MSRDYHDIPQGLRYIISESVQREVLDPLLELNHARYEGGRWVCTQRAEGERRKEERGGYAYRCHYCGEMVKLDGSGVAR